MSTRLVHAEWERELRAAIKLGGPTLRFVCPFIKESVITRLVQRTNLDSITVVTRFSLSDFAHGVSDIGALEVLDDAGADVRGLQDLHSKVFVFGSACAMVTSANLTEAGLARNPEFGCISTDGDFVAACDSYVTRLHRESEPLDPDKLDEWQATVNDSLRRAGRDPLGSLPDYGAAPSRPPAPPVRVAPAVDASNEGWTAESQRAFIKFAGRGRERSPLDTRVLDEIDRSGSFKFCSYPKGGGHIRRVWDGDTMFLSRMTHTPNDHRIIGRATGIEHDDEKDVATTAEIREREWLEEFPFLVRVHHPVFINGVLGDGISLDELMDELQADSFLSTQERARAGEADVNPRQSLARKADVRLSPEAFRWLTHRFEDALARHGSIPQAEIDTLT